MSNYLQNMRKIGLYIHIPFCVRKCNYCDFVSFSDKFDYVDIYFSQLKKELQSIICQKNDFVFNTVYIGGGTPSYVDSQYIIQIMSIIKDIITKDCEVTIEVNPATVDLCKLSDYISAGINRISIGIQSFEPNLLNSLGRIHSSKNAIDTVLLAKKAGFKNINIDLIYGVPSVCGQPQQTISDWMNTLNIARDLGVQHISAYSLIIEEGTNVYKWGCEYIDDTIDREMFYMCKNVLEKKGYMQYEISNFAIPGYESKHNIRYWKCDEYIGVGLNSASYFDGIRYKNTDDFHRYLIGNYLDENETVILTESDKMNEFMMLGFRMIDGPCPEEFKQRFHKDFMDVFGEKLLDLSKRGLIVKTNGRYNLTPKGLDYANEIFREFV